MVAACNLWTPEAKREILNPYSEVERLQVMLSCSFKAVSVDLSICLSGILLTLRMAYLMQR